MAAPAPAGWQPVLPHISDPELRADRGDGRARLLPAGDAGAPGAAAPGGPEFPLCAGCGAGCGPLHAAYRPEESFFEKNKVGLIILAVVIVVAAVILYVYYRSREGTPLRRPAGGPGPCGPPGYGACPAPKPPAPRPPPVGPDIAAVVVVSPAPGKNGAAPEAGSIRELTPEAEDAAVGEADGEADGGVDTGADAGADAGVESAAA